ncbi:MAG: oxygen-independent coproporphyrinogen III oxidase [Bdellovibrionales bacterium]
MTGSNALYSSVLPALDEQERLDLDDPFIGLLGQKTGRDELWLGRAVPRYTSYPPATAFQEGVSVEAYRKALAGLSPEEPVSLYLHVPFCQALCLYCGCNTCATQRYDRVTYYLGFVLRELENVGRLSERSRRVGRIHMGGGSPNILSEKDFGLLFGELIRRYDLSTCQEIAVELDPRLVTKAQAKVLSLFGVSRVSLGVQDFDPAVQEIIGRKQPFEQVRAVCETLREGGIGQISFDLMYGLPLQSPASMALAAEEAASLRPDRISLFSYAHVPQAKKHQKALEKYILPGPYACLAMESAARKVLCDAGYVEIGMDHFALPADSLAVAAREGRLHRNFQGYTDDHARSLIGIGASSIGRLPEAYYQNVRDAQAYEEAIRKDGLAVTRGVAIRSEDKLRAEVIETLMCTMAVNLEELCHKHHYALSTFSEELEALEPYERAGVVKRQGLTLRLSVPHRMAVRVIASLFDKTQRSVSAPVSRAV